MIPELGQFALILALLLAAAQGLLPLAGAASGRVKWMASAPSIARGQALFVVIAFAALTCSFAVNDFSVAYVAANSNSALPLHYRVSAVWGAHEGSLLLWVFVLACWTLAVCAFSRDLPLALLSRVLGVMGLVSFGFIAFMLFTSNPFDRAFPTPSDGNDLNPLLQDPGLIFHPPLLYTGYVGFCVVFAFAIAALLGGRLDTAWARWSRPWTLVAWSFLTLGIALGSFWAYYELGWGGWWFWDPVENASFMPWLAGTALIHSLAATEKRGVLKGWTVLLAICVFALSLLGAFLVRSGVLTSVHAFATDPARGVFVLLLLGLTVGGSLVLYALRASTLGNFAATFEPVSRESALLVNNVLLFVAMLTVLLGTLYPLAAEALGLGKLSVGPPYFNSVFLPLMAVVALLIGPGALLRWKRDAIVRVAVQLRLAAASALAAGLFVVLATRDAAGLGAGLALALGLWIAGGMAVALRLRLRPLSGLGRRLASVSAAQWGMTLAHVGFAIALIGVAMSSLYSTEEHRRMSPGERIEVSGYAFEFVALREVSGPNYRANQAQFEVHRRGRAIATLTAEKRVYHVRGMPMTEAGIDGAFTRDLYVSLGEPLEGQAWSVRLYVKPFIRWIWLGALLIAAGGIVAALDRRYRLAVAARDAQIARGRRGLAAGA